MADPQPMSLPVPPDDPVVEDMHKWMLSIYNWHKNTVINGVQTPFYSQDQLNQMNKLDQSGKIFFNNDTGKFCAGYIEGGNLVIKTLATE